MEVTIFTDGGSRGNPGPAAIGVVILNGPVVLHEISSVIGIATNNDAEYQACIASLEWLLLREQPVTKVTWRLDSKLVVEQLSKRWKIKDPKIKGYAEICWKHLRELAVPSSFNHVPRADNSHADALVNQALDAASDQLAP